MTEIVPLSGGNFTNVTANVAYFIVKHSDTAPAFYVTIKLRPTPTPT